MVALKCVLENGSIAFVRPITVFVRAHHLPFIPGDVVEQVSNTSNGRWWSRKHGFKSFIQFLVGLDECCIHVDPFRRVGAIVRPYMAIPTALGLRDHFSQRVAPIDCGSAATQRSPM